MSHGLETDIDLDPLFAALDLKAKSLLVTVWGDCVAPHGGTVWLKSLIDLVEPLGLNERVVRTAVFRLQREELLSSEQAGRRSFYSLTRTGRHRFAEATRRIYASGDIPWNGKWLLLFLARRDLDDKVQRALHNELGWLGFGAFGGGIYAHPGQSRETLEALLSDHKVTKCATILETADAAPRLYDNPAILVRKGWNLDDLEADYARFIGHFGRFGGADRPAAQLDEKKCFIIRSLLVHDYRRVLLRDPMLPAELLPGKWNGSEARALCRDIYQQVWQGAERHLMSVLEHAGGRLPPASEEFMARFGGLER
ncbi:MAG: phenylacetic acid degradation operon negative regulatory protein PaaX [Alphaproteobacteria bacterium]|nr:MAG: phenylacetic acid degradation operon negative regulatory protein PaaX [Alphaproteobacteria bacterium]